MVPSSLAQSGQLQTIKSIHQPPLLRLDRLDLFLDIVRRLEVLFIKHVPDTVCVSGRVLADDTGRK